MLLLGEERAILLCRRGALTLNADEMPVTCSRINLTDEQRRAPRILARHPHGCAEAVLLEQGSPSVSWATSCSQVLPRYDRPGARRCSS
jgi:hypothetical protein